MGQHHSATKWCSSAWSTGFTRMVYSFIPPKIQQEGPRPCHQIRPMINCFFNVSMAKFSAIYMYIHTYVYFDFHSYKRPIATIISLHPGGYYSVCACNVDVWQSHIYLKNSRI